MVISDLVDDFDGEEKAEVTAGGVGVRGSLWARGTASDGRDGGGKRVSIHRADGLSGFVIAAAGDSVCHCAAAAQIPPSPAFPSSGRLHRRNVA